MKLPDRLLALRATFRELGPLRGVAAYTAIVPTAGMLVLFASLDRLAQAVPAEPWLALAAGFAAVAFAVGAVLLPSSAAMLGAGYCLGAPLGLVAGSLGMAVGSLLAQRFLAVALPRRFLAFLRARPRVVAVQRLGSGSLWQGSLGVACLRAMSLFPLAVGNLMLAAAPASAPRIVLGTVLGTLPSALLAAMVGDTLRSWRADGSLPSVPYGIAAGAAALLGAFCLRTSRRRWRAMGAPG